MKFKITMDKKKLLISSIFMATMMMSIIIVPVMAKTCEVTITVKDINTKRPAPNKLIRVYGSIDGGLRYGILLGSLNSDEKGRAILSIEDGLSLTDLEVYVAYGTDTPYHIRLNPKMIARLTAFVTVA
jgi:hypothetical protein